MARTSLCLRRDGDRWILESVDTVYGVFRTMGEAVNAALERIRTSGGGGELVVLEEDGTIVRRQSHPEEGE